MVAGAAYVQTRTQQSAL